MNEHRRSDDMDWVETLKHLFDDWQIDPVEIHEPSMIHRLYDRYSDPLPTDSELAVMHSQAERLIQPR